jgi:hypothetical protein
MYAVRNKVQLIGTVNQVFRRERKDGKGFSHVIVCTEDNIVTLTGETMKKVKQSHLIVFTHKLHEIVEKYVTVDREIAVEGTLCSDEENESYVYGTELLMLGATPKTTL